MNDKEDLGSLESIQAALLLEHFGSDEAHKRMAPKPRGLRSPETAGNPREGAVLLILYRKRGTTHIVLTKRREDLNAHAGQISFPGGRREEGESLESTALREAQEEIGIDLSHLRLLGRLTCLYIPPTDYEVHPFVGWYDGSQAFVRQVTEVAEIIEVPLSSLLDPENHFEEAWEIRGYDVEVPFFRAGGHKVWGATAMMLSEFLERIKAANS